MISSPRYFRPEVPTGTSTLGTLGTFSPGVLPLWIGASVVLIFLPRYLQYQPFRNMAATNSDSIIPRECTKQEIQGRVIEKRTAVFIYPAHHYPADFLQCHPIRNLISTIAYLGTISASQKPYS